MIKRSLLQKAGENSRLRQEGAFVWFQERMRFLPFWRKLLHFIRRSACPRKLWEQALYAAFQHPVLLSKLPDFRQGWHCGGGSYLGYGEV